MKEFNHLLKVVNRNVLHWRHQSLMQLFAVKIIAVGVRGWTIQSLGLSLPHSLQHPGSVDVRDICVSLTIGTIMEHGNGSQINLCKPNKI